MLQIKYFIETIRQNKNTARIVMRKILKSLFYLIIAFFSIIKMNIGQIIAKCQV